MQGPQLCTKPRHFCKLNVATSRMAFLDLNLLVLQDATPNSNNWGRSVVQNCRYLQVFFHTWYYSLISMRLIYYFDTWAIIWHGIVPVFLKICTDLQEICSIWAQNCFWTILQVTRLKLFRNNNKNNFVFKCCKFLANLCKSSEILKQYDVKWWFNYTNYASVSYSFSCNQIYLNSYYISSRYDKNIIFEWTNISFLSARQ